MFKEILAKISKFFGGIIGYFLTEPAMAFWYLAGDFRMACVYGIARYIYKERSKWPKCIKQFG